MDIPMQQAMRGSNRRKPRRVRVHVGEAATYNAKRLVRMRKGVQKAIEGYRHGCTCHEADMYLVQDQNEYNMLRFSKAWIWGKEFQKTIYYI